MCQITDLLAPRIFRVLIEPRAPSFLGFFPDRIALKPLFKTRFQMRDGRPELFRLPEMNFIDNKAGEQ